MRKFWSLQADRPNWVGVTKLFTYLNKPAPITARTYHNSSKMANTALVNTTLDPNTALATVNAKRGVLVLQNNSTATAPDTAPDLYFGFGMVPVAGYDLKLAPGEGVIFDVHCPTDAIYCVIGEFSNGFGSVQVAGVVKESSITDDAQDTANGSSNQQFQQIISLLTTIAQALAPKA